MPPPLQKAPESIAVALILVFIVAGPTVLNYLLNLWTLKVLPASTVSGFISLQTLIGVSFSNVILGEEMRTSYSWAAGCILLSVILLSFRSLTTPARLARKAQLLQE